MNKTLTAILMLLTVVTTWTVSAASFAQEPHHSAISISHPGVTALLADLKSLIDLTTETEQEQWENIRDFTEALVVGVDGDQPIRVDVLTGVTPTVFQFWVPLVKPQGTQKMGDDFRENMEVSGYATRRDSQNHNLYRIDGTENDDVGWLHILPDVSYGIFLLTTDKEDLQLLRQVILKARDPRADITAETGPGISIAAAGVNPAETPEDQAKRRRAFSDLRKLSMDTIRKRPDESVTRFELRRMLLRHQLDEGERLMVEAKSIRAAAHLSRDTHQASLKFSATAIPGTSLAESIRLFGTQPDPFGAVPRRDGSALSVRVNHPIDQLRQANVVEFLDLVRNDVDHDTDASTTMTAEEKAATKQAFSDLVKLTQDGIRTGYVSAMVESTPAAGGGFTTIAAISAPDATRLTGILPGLAAAGKGNEVELGVGEVGSVVIHRVQLAEGFVHQLDRLFGAKRDLFVGVDASRVWLASGPGALDAMKSMISTLGEPRQSTTTLRIDANLLPWVRRLDEIAKTAVEGKTAEDKKLQRDWARMRSRAISAMESGDLVTLDVRVEEGVVQGEMAFGTGILRFAGKMMAAMSKENLE